MGATTKPRQDINFDYKFNNVVFWIIGNWFTNDHVPSYLKSALRLK